MLPRASLLLPCLQISRRCLAARLDGEPAQGGWQETRRHRLRRRHSPSGPAGGQQRKLLAVRASSWRQRGLQPRSRRRSAALGPAYMRSSKGTRWAPRRGTLMSCRRGMCEQTSLGAAARCCLGLRSLGLPCAALSPVGLLPAGDVLVLSRCPCCCSFRGCPCGWSFLGLLMLLVLVGAAHAASSPAQAARRWAAPPPPPRPPTAPAAPSRPPGCFSVAAQQTVHQHAGRMPVGG